MTARRAWGLYSTLSGLFVAIGVLARSARISPSSGAAAIGARAGAARQRSPPISQKITKTEIAGASAGLPRRSAAISFCMARSRSAAAAFSKQYAA